MPIPASTTKREQPQLAARAIVVCCAVFWCWNLVGCGTLQYQKQSKSSADARALTYEGLAALDRGHSERATTLLEQAQQANPHDDQVHVHLSRSLEVQGQLDQAIMQMKQAVELSRDPFQHVRLGELYMKRFQPQMAEQQAQLAIDLDRRNPEGWTLKGQSQVVQGQLQAALSSLHRASSLAPENDQIKMTIARVYNSLGQHARALSMVESMRQRFSPNREPLQLVELESEVLLHLGQSDRVVARLGTVMENLPPERQNEISERSYLVLAQAYQLSGDLPNSQLTAALARENYPNSQQVAEYIAAMPSPTESGVANLR